MLVYHICKFKVAVHVMLDISLLSKISGCMSCFLKNHKAFNCSTVHDIGGGDLDSLTFVHMY